MKYINKTSGSIRLAALLAGATLFGSVSQNALALTQSGTSISNTATLSYSVNLVGQTDIPSAVAFTVDNKVNLTVSGGVQTSTTPGQVGALTPFTVTNNGNATQGYNLVAANAASGAYTVAGAITDNFDPVAALTIYRDNNCDSAINGADAAVTTIPTLNVGTTACLLVSTDIAASRVNSDAAVVSLKATTTWPTPLVAGEEPAAVVAGAVVTATAGANTAGVDVVLADVAGVIAGDAASDGAHSTYGAFKVVSAVLSVSKVTTVICDPINGNVNPKNIPGAAVQYAVTITNAVGAASATLSQITDTLTGTLAFDPKLNSGALPATNCVSGNVANTLSATGFGAVSGAGVVTSYAAPGLAGQAVTAGASVAAGVVTIDFPTLSSPTYGLVGGVLPADSFVTVYFNAFVQ